MPPPVSAAMLAELCGQRNGRCAVSAPPSISPATDAIMETSNNSDGDSGGRIDGSRAASIDLPAPGAPIISSLCSLLIIRQIESSPKGLFIPAVFPSGAAEGRKLQASD